MRGWSVPTIKTGSGTIGQTAAQMTATETPCDQGVCIKSRATNLGVIYVGSASTLTAGVAAPTTDGFPIYPGEAVDFPIDDMSKLWLIASLANQTYSFLRR